jgi:PleD family two-component response regulator
LHEAVGPQAAVEVLKALGEYANRRFNSIGGFSARHRRDEILTILPHTNLDEARQLVAGFAEALQQKVLTNIQNIAIAHLGTEACFDIYIYAGVTEMSPTDEIDLIIERAQAAQEIVATHRCESGGNIE